MSRKRNGSITKRSNYIPLRLYPESLPERQTRRVPRTNPFTYLNTRGIIPYRGGTMALIVPDGLLRAAGMSEAEFKRELAVWLFQQERLTLAQASQFAEMTLVEFQHLLASRRIPVHYDVAEFEEDLQTLRELAKDEGCQ